MPTHAEPTHMRDSRLRLKPSQSLGGQRHTEQLSQPHTGCSRGSTSTPTKTTLSNHSIHMICCLHQSLCPHPNKENDAPHSSTTATPDHGGSPQVGVDQNNATERPKLSLRQQRKLPFAHAWPTSSRDNHNTHHQGRHRCYSPTNAEYKRNRPRNFRGTDLLPRPSAQ